MTAQIQTPAQQHHGPRWFVCGAGGVRKASGELEEKSVTKELHHIAGRRGPNPHNIDNLQEYWLWEHVAVDPFRRTGYKFVEVKK
jgi:hypothetical protein